MKISSNSLKIDWSKVRSDQPGSWPTILKILACVVVVIVVIFLGHLLLLKGKQIELNEAAVQEIDLRKEFEAKAFQAKNLSELRKQMEVANQTLGALLKQLPSDTEVPGLLEDITRTGLGSGLEFDEIKLQAETNRDFYVELPISLKVQGSYHDLATFVSSVSALPRIVTLHDLKIVPTLQNNSILNMEIIAKTYRYNSADEDGDGDKKEKDASDQTKSGEGKKP